MTTKWSALTFASIIATVIISFLHALGFVGDFVNTETLIPIISVVLTMAGIGGGVKIYKHKNEAKIEEAKIYANDEAITREITREIKLKDNYANSSLKDIRIPRDISNVDRFNEMQKNIKSDTLNSDLVENMKNRLGMQSSTSAFDVIEQLEKISGKSNATQKALKLTARDYLIFGVKPSSNL